MASRQLTAPTNLRIDFAPSGKQYEVWKSLQPECPYCGGEIIQKECGVDKYGRPTYHPVCSKCGSMNIPQMVLCGGAGGGGKAALLDSNVCTPFGFRKVRDLKIGSIITNPKTGGMQKVIWLHPIERHPYYRIHFVDKTTFDCSEGHLWECHVSRNKSKRAKNHGIDNKVCTTKEMFQWYENKKNGKHKGTHLIIPLTKPVQFTIGCHKLTIDPYILGAIIGDGCIADSTISHGFVLFTNKDKEIVDRFVAAGYDMSHWSLKEGTDAKNYIIRDKNLIKQLKELNINGNKSQDHYIPKQYKYATIDNRILLMQGLIDTDGYVDNRGHIVYTTTSAKLADDVAFIVRSLGGVATITRGKSGYKKDGTYIDCNDSYDVQIRTKINPDLCGLKRKKERAKYEYNGGASELGKRIVDIEYIGIREGRCITVDDPSGLYVVDNFTVTHNSYLMSCWLISSCIRFPDIRMVVARKTLKSLKESTLNTIKMVLRKWGLVEDKHYLINNLEGHIKFWNESKIIFVEMADNPSDSDFNRFGSMEITGAAIDEVSEISEKAVEVLFSRIRYRTHETFKVPKMVMSTNPCLGWVRSRFVQDDDGNPVQCREGELFIPFTVDDNPDLGFRQTYMASLDKISDPSVKARLRYGNWDFVESNKMAAYWNFDGNKHLVTNLREKVYNPMKPIISGWDFNVAPYMSEMDFQIDYEKKEIYLLQENLGKPEDKENNTPKLAQKVKNIHLNNQHLGGIIVTGDPAGLARSTQTEEGVNNYTIIVDNMNNAVLRPRIKLLQKQPPQARRLEFVNAILNGYDGWKFKADLRCRKFTEDMIYQQKNSDGTKCKQKVLNPKTGGKEEKYGHLSDILDYVLVLFLNDSWRHFQNQSTTITTSTAQVYNLFEY